MATAEPRPEAGDGEPDDDAVEGQVVPFPRTPPAPVRHHPGQPGEWRPIIPEHLRTAQGISKALRWHSRRARHHSLYHGVRAPKRLVLTIGWAAVGLARIVFAQLGWWWVSEQAHLRHDAAASGDTQKWLSLHKHVREVRLVRGLVLLGEVVALVVAAAVVTSYSVLLWIPVGLVAVPVLAWIGRPADRPIMTSAVVPAAAEKLTMETIVRVLGALGIGEMNKALREYPDKAIVPIDPPMRDGPGWLARLDLPHGVTAGAVSEKREELASGLHRPLGCVWPETDHKRHPGALNLYVSDEDMTTAEQPPGYSPGAARPTCSPPSRSPPTRAAGSSRSRSCSRPSSSARFLARARRCCSASCCSSVPLTCAARSTPTT